ncbi:MAG: tRNA (adenosine(37)-N6)-threonylcarbamoyltransferase complex dimerization subunit type 1 TsaB [Erysipelotrichaceae bacterium]|nr:tRNA (adenosine(37)-N6)-threonylcarbamoyltransferase complex dimerization subunit type 1 TsaB [Erysipelotrichaceae bacterium]
MLTLCIDTAYKYLTAALIRDDEIVAAISNECFKRQSEEVFVVLDELFRKAGIARRDIDSMCISSGPGSYTGVRIAMTIAKVYCRIADIALYKISTLKLYAGGKERTMVVMDARAKRAYVAVYDKNECLLKDQAMPLEMIDPQDYDVVLDGHLIGKEDKEPDIPSCFLNVKGEWEKVKEIDFLAPEYLKESSEYYR